MVLTAVMTASIAGAAGAGETEKIPVTMWGSLSGGDVEHVEALVDRYNQSQDQYEVTYYVQDSMEEKLITAIAGGEVPDVVLWDRFTTGTYAAKGAFLALDDYVEADGIDLAKFYDVAVQEMRGADGKLYGIPVTTDARIIFYNKDLLSEAGVDPESIKTWDDLEAAAVAAFNSEAGLTVLEFWNKLLNEDKVYELGFEDSFGGDGFKAGKVAMCFNGPWALSSLNDTEINYGVLEQPEGPAGVRSAMMGGFGLVIPSKAENVDAAWDFIKWWTTVPENSVDFAKESGYLPANKDAAANEYFMNDEILSVFSETMLYASTRMQVPGYSDVEVLALRPQLDLFVAGSIDAQGALETAARQGDAILQEASE